ncbi:MULTISPECIES: hypothetical protein [unclassified Microcoleus]|uniref:hypothetical protein n=1 Tax=unclassified Microcoleus TaxID=2642155 RepID=UPI002FD730B4
MFTKTPVKNLSNSILDTVFLGELTVPLDEQREELFSGGTFSGTLSLTATTTRTRHDVDFVCWDDNKGEIVCVEITNKGVA